MSLSVIDLLNIAFVAARLAAAADFACFGGHESGHQLNVMNGDEFVETHSRFGDKVRTGPFLWTAPLHFSSRFRRLRRQNVGRILIRGCASDGPSQSHASQKVSLTTMRPFNKKPFVDLVLGFVIGLTFVSGIRDSNVFGQEGHRTHNYTYYAPATTAFAAQIHANADFQRALGESAIDFAVARKIRAEAFSKEIDNSVAVLEAYWDRKAIYRAEQFRRYVAPLEQEQLRKSKQWDWLENDPNFAPEAIQNGKAMNLLLDRLAMTVLTYSYTSTHSQDDQDLRRRLKLKPEVIHQLFLRESVGRAGMRFRADSQDALSIDWWPWVFRKEADLKKPREQFDKARVDLVKNLATNDGPQKLQTLLDRYWDMRTALDQWFEGHKKDSGFVAQGSPTHYLDGKRFLESVFGEIHRLQRTGSSSLLVGRSAFDGDNLLDLMAFMSKSALKFDAAQPGEEAGYHQVFQLMRDVYVTVDDAWMKDKDKLRDIELRRQEVAPLPPDAATGKARGAKKK